MDLFSLVAKLTLDAKDYEKALKTAENKGKGAKLDANGTVSLTDNYSATLDGLQKQGANLDVQGTATLDARNYHTQAMTAGNEAAHSLDAEGVASMSGETYSETASGLSETASEELDAEGEATLDAEQYDGKAEEIAEAAESTLDAEGEATLSGENYGTNAETLSAEAADKLDAEGEASLSDSGYLEEAASLSGTASESLDAEGEASLATWQYQQDAENLPEDVDIDATGDATLETGEYQETASTAAGEVGDQLDASGDATLNTDNYGTNVDGLAEGIGDALDAEGEATLDDSEYESDAETMASGVEMSGDLDAEGDATLNDDGYEADISSAAANAEGQLDIVGYASLNTDDYDASLKSSGEKAGGSFADSFMGALKVAGIVAGVGTVANAFMDAVNDTVAFADEIDKGSQRLGISARAYQEWSYALSQSGASINSLNKGILNLKNARVGEMSDDVAEAFDALAIDPTKYETTEQLLSDTIMALAGIDSGSRETLLTKIFGKNGSELAAFFNSGQDGIKQLIKDAADLGLIMSDEDIKTNVELGDKMANIGKQVDAITMQLVSSLGPTLITICDAVIDVLSFLQGETSGLQKWVNEYGPGMGFYYWNLYGDQDEDFIKGFKGNKEATEYRQTDEYKAAVAQDEATQIKALTDFFAGKYGITIPQGMGKANMQATAQLNAALIRDLLADLQKEGSGVTRKDKDEYGNNYGIMGQKAVQITINGQSRMVVEANMMTDTDFINWLMLQYAKKLGYQLPSFSEGEYTMTTLPTSNAKGLWDVPYDNYLADLHRDEMVLTASQAREYRDEGNDSGAIVTAIHELRTDMTNLKLVVGEKMFGRTVVRYGGKRMNGYIGESEGRIAAGYGWG